MTIVLYVLAAVVAGAAAWTSFDALHQLADLCHLTRPELLPVTIDAGALAGSVAWLFARRLPARRFGRAVTFALLAASIVGNAAVHVVGPVVPTWVAVAVSSVFPAVLGAVVHLVLLVVGAPAGDQAGEAAGGREAEPNEEDGDPGAGAAEATPIGRPVGRRKLAEQLGIPEWEARKLLEKERAA